MKKLMIAAAIVCAAAFAQAATVSWSTDSDTIYASDGSGKAGANYAVYFLTSVDYAYANAVADIGKNDFAFLSNTKTGQSGSMVLSESDGYAENAKVGPYDNGITTEAYLVVFDAESVAEAKHVFITDGTDILEISGLGGSDPIDFDMGATKTAGNWQSVPEPTSGLLLLLGVAGLALRRRRA